MATFTVTLCDGESRQPLPCVNGHYVAVPGNSFAIKAECPTGDRLCVDDPHVRGGGGYGAVVAELDGVSVDDVYNGQTMCDVTGWSVLLTGLNDDNTLRPFMFGFPKYVDDARACNANPTSVGSITVRFPKCRLKVSGWPKSQAPQFEGVRFAKNAKKDVARMVTVATGPCVSAHNRASWTRDRPSATEKVVTVRYATAEMLEAKGILDPENNREHRKYFPNRDFGAGAGTCTQPTPRAPVRVKRERQDTEVAQTETVTTIDMTDASGATKITVVERKRRRTVADVELD